MRTYTIPNNFRSVFNARFETVVVDLLKKHGIQLIGAWDYYTGELQNFMYIVAYKDLADKEKQWAAFNADPDWKAAKAKTLQEHGQIISRNESTILKPAAFSPLQ